MTVDERIRRIAVELLDPKVHAALMKGEPDETDAAGWLNWYLLLELWRKAVYQAGKALTVADQTR